MGSLKLAAAYIRVSTDDQVEYSPESQIKAIREYCKSNGFILSNEFIFQDDGKSGRNVKNRPEFNRMIALAKEKPTPFNSILVWKFSRFARNQEESIFYKSMLKKNDIEVISISESVVEGPFGDLIERIIEWFDEYYSIRLSGEVKRGMIEKVSRGEAVSIAPFGYKLVNKELIVIPDEARIVRKIFDDLASGKPYRTLAIEINAMGFKTHRGNTFETRTVEYIANNPIYLNKIRWNPTGKTRRNYHDENIMITDGHHEAIITEEQWDKTHDVIKKLKNMYKKNAKPCSCANIVQGLIRCSACGSTLIKAGAYLQCCKYSKGQCTTSHSVSYSDIVTTVVDQIEKDFKTGNFKVIEKNPVINDHNDIILKQIASEERKYDRIKQAFENGIDTIEEYKTNKERISNEIQLLKSKLKAPEENTQSQNANKLITQHCNSISILRDENVPIVEKNTILRSFIDKIVFDKTSRNLDFYYYL